MGKAVTDMGAVISAPLMVIGEKLGLYKAMAGAGPLTSQELAEQDGRSRAVGSRVARNQAAGEYLTYDAETDRYELPAEHAMALADEDSPVYLLGAFELIASLYADEDKILEAFRTGKGMGWHEHDHAPVPRHRALLPSRLQGPPGGRVDPGAGGRAGEARQAARRSPTSAAATAPRRSSWPQAFPNSQFYRLRLPRRLDRASTRAGRGGRRRRPGHVRGRFGARTSRAAATTSSACSTACTTWATRSAPPSTSARHSPTTARG